MLAKPLLATFVASCNLLRCNGDGLTVLPHLRQLFGIPGCPKRSLCSQGLEPALWVAWLRPEGRPPAGQADRFDMEGNWVWKKLEFIPSGASRTTGPSLIEAVELNSVVYAAPPYRGTRYKLFSPEEEAIKDTKSVAYTFQVLASATQSDAADAEMLEEVLRNQLVQQTGQDVPDIELNADDGNDVDGDMEE